MNEDLKQFVLKLMDRLIDCRGELKNQNAREAVNAVCHALATADPEIEAAARDRFDTIKGL